VLGFGGFTLRGEDFNAGSLETELVQRLFLKGCHDVLVIIV